MAGQIIKMIEKIIEERGKGNQSTKDTIRMKLTLDGFNKNRFNEQSPDDPAMIAKLRALALTYGVTLKEEA